QPRQLVPRQQVEQGRGGNERRPGEVVRTELRDVGHSSRDDDFGAVGGLTGHVGGGRRQQVCVSVVQDPALRPWQERREPPSHRAAAAGEIVDRPAALNRNTATEPADEVPRPRGAVRSFAQLEPARADPDRLDGHRAAPWRTSAPAEVVVDQPASDARRSPAAARNRWRRPASSSQVRSASPSAAGSPGATSRPGRVPSALRPRASGTPPTSAATTGKPRASASATTIPYVSARDGRTSTSAAA